MLIGYYYYYCYPSEKGHIRNLTRKSFSRFVSPLLTALTLYNIIPSTWDVRLFIIDVTENVKIDVNVLETVRVPNLVGKVGT